MSQGRFGLYDSKALEWWGVAACVLLVLFWGSAALGEDKPAPLATEGAAAEESQVPPDRPGIPRNGAEQPDLFVGAEPAGGAGARFQDIRLTLLQGDADKPATPQAPAKEAAVKGPPLPFHSIEGYSGGSITPMGYLCNCGPEACRCSKPSVSYSFLNIGSREMHVLSVTQVLFRRIEIGYAANFLNVGSLVDDVRSRTGVSLRDHVTLHHFNLRGQLVEENSYDLPLPAVTAGVHFKYNDGVGKMNSQLGGALSAIGYEKSHGVDYTLTATKMFPKLAFGRPLILTGGLRNSAAAQIGLLGFGNDRKWTFEGSVVCLPTDFIVLGYEFRQKENPYNIVKDLVGKEDNWHAFSVSWIVNNRLTFSAVYGMMGNVANARTDDALGLQLKFEF